MPGVLAYHMVLRACYAMPGTDTAYWQACTRYKMLGVLVSSFRYLPTHLLRDVRYCRSVRWQLVRAFAIDAPVRGSARYRPTPYRAMRLLRGVQGAVLHAWYAMSGTESGYGPTRLLRDVRYERGVWYYALVYGTTRRY
eukprot:979943-Rhodomonas_salina.4